jgi:DMSO/TMAO reductase YedYZ molybdopterin-dependent catalytic subunit
VDVCVDVSVSVSVCLCACARSGPPHWVAGAIANSTWTGVRLRDVLRAAGMDVDAISLGKIPAPDAASIGLTGYDHDEVGNQYCCSFPFEKAIDPFGDTILAFKMNGQDIPRPHGFPIRAIVRIFYVFCLMWRLKIFFLLSCTAMAR